MTPLVALRLRLSARSEKVAQQESRCIRQSPAAVLQLPADAERPTAERFYGKLRAEELRIAAALTLGALAAAQDMIGAGHLSEKKLVLEPEARERLVIR